MSANQSAPRTIGQVALTEGTILPIEAPTEGLRPEQVLLALRVRPVPLARLVRPVAGNSCYLDRIIKRFFVSRYSPGSYRMGLVFPEI